MTTSEQGTTPNNEDAKHRVGWFELFYDLVLVATINRAAQVVGESPTWSTAGLIGGGMAVILVLWFATTVNLGSFSGREGLRQILVVVQMIAMVIAALATGQDTGLPTVMGFLALTVAFASIAVLYRVSATGEATAQRVGRTISRAAFAAAGVFALGALLVVWQPPGVALLEVACVAAAVLLLALTLLGRPLRRLVESGHMSTEHLQERAGQLVLIVLGESLIYLVKNLSGLPSIPHLPLLVLTIIVVFAIWRIYFTTIFPAGLPAEAGVIRAWLLLHVVLIFGAVCMAAALSSMAVVGMSDPLPAQVDTWTVLPVLSVMTVVLLLTLGQRRRSAANSAARLLWDRLSIVHAVAVGLLIALWPLCAGGPMTDSRWSLALGSLVIIADAVASGWVVRSCREAQILPAP